MRRGGREHRIQIALHQPGQITPASLAGFRFEVLLPPLPFRGIVQAQERLARASGLTEADLVTALHELVGLLEFVNEAEIPVGTWMEAYRLCKGIDTDDTPYVALALNLDCRLWTEDRELKTGLRARGFDRFFET